MEINVSGKSFFSCGISLLVLGITFVLFFKFIHTEKNPKYIIIFLSDSLRPDHMGCYGYDKTTTPFIDEVAKRGLIFENAFTSGCCTPIAIPSLFTGLYFFQHKAKDVKNGVLDGTIAVEKSLLFISEVLKMNGFKTYGLTSIPVIRGKIGFDQGFDKYSVGNQADILKDFFERFTYNFSC